MPAFGGKQFQERTTVILGLVKMGRGEGREKEGGVIGRLF